MTSEDAYSAGYWNGRRLAHIPSAIDDPSHDASKWVGLDETVQRHAAAYARGFSDGWHGAPPIYSGPPEDVTNMRVG